MSNFVVLPKRVSKPSRKVKENTAAEAVSNTDRIKRADKQEQLSCDFTDHNDIKKKFPPYVGKGQGVCPQWFLAKADTQEGKMKLVLLWNGYSVNQQKGLQNKYKEALLQRSSATRGGTKRSAARSSRRSSSGSNKKQSRPRTNTLAHAKQIAGEIEDNLEEWERLRDSESNRLEREEKAVKKRSEQRAAARTSNVSNVLLLYLLLSISVYLIYLYSSLLYCCTGY